MLNRTRILISVFIYMAVVSIAFGTTRSFNTIAIKAERFYAQKEWASASAMYELMLDERPRDYSLYAKAIVSAAMVPDTIEEMNLVDKAFANLCPVDTLFNRVEKASFAIGQSTLYEQLLLKVKTAYPWTRRLVDARLLDYYSFRNAASDMLAYSDIMLAGAPDSPKFLMIKARALLLSGRNRDAEIILNRLIELNPDNVQALIMLGNYYLIEHEKNGNDALLTRAKDLLRRANTLEPTPYLEATLQSL